MAEKNKHPLNKNRKRGGNEIRNLIKSELSYLKKEQILITGPKKQVYESALYFHKDGKHHKITILATSKNVLIGFLELTSKFNGLRYIIAKNLDTGLPDEEFGLIIAYDIFNNIGLNKSITMLKEFYRIAKPNGIVIILGENISAVLKHYNKANFSSAEIIEYKGLRYLKLIKLNEISLLPP